jgi:hypothetical protein
MRLTITANRSATPIDRIVVPTEKMKVTLSEFR